MSHQGGLRTPMLVGVDSSEAQAIHSRWNTIDWAVEQLANIGVVTLPHPNYECPVIEPGTLNDLSSADYTTTYEKLLGWFGCYAEKLAYAKAMVNQSENEMTFIEVTTKKSTYAKSGGGRKPNAEQLNIEVETDPRYTELKILSQKWRQYRDMLQGRMDTVEANLKAVSRHIEIRKLDREGSNTGRNMPNRGTTKTPRL